MGTPICWRCKTREGVVRITSAALECVPCVEQTISRMRGMLNDIDEVVRTGLSSWPRMMDRVEFVRECIQLHREAGQQSQRVYIMPWATVGLEPGEATGVVLAEGQMFAIAETEEPDMVCLHIEDDGVRCAEIAFHRHWLPDLANVAARAKR